VKTVLFVPGFQEDMKTRDYGAVIQAIESKGYQVKFISIQWKRTTITNWVGELEAIYNEYDAKDVVLAGFSYGSMTAFMAAAKRNPVKLWLFSFSPYFSDDIPELEKSWLRNIGHRRAEAFQQLHFKKLAAQIACPVLIVLGEVEATKYPLLKRRSVIAHEEFSNSRLIEAHGSDHDVGDPSYVETIRSEI
jgi:pimeloyl-ACP methyl ester carboxylesterase